MRQRSIGLAHDEYLQVAKSLATHNLHALTATRMERVVDCRLAALIVGTELSRVPRRDVVPAASTVFFSISG